MQGSLPHRGARQSQRRDAAPLRVALLDADTGFLAALLNRTGSLGWEHRVLSADADAGAIARMRRDALVLDLSLLGSARWEWLKRVCERRHSFVVLVCAGPSTLPERLLALRLGADAWLEKPCHPEELIARVEALVRRSGGHGSAGRSVWVGELEIRPDRHQAFLAANELSLTRRELQLATLLAEAGGEPVARELIYERVWGHVMQRDERSVDVLVSKLRRKLQDASTGWRYVRTHTGVGYSLDPEPERELGILEPAESESVAAQQPVAA